MSMLAQLYELCLEKRDKYSCFVRLMSHYWPLLRDFQTDRALMLVYFIALSHRPVGVDKLGQLFSLFLNCRVTVEKGFEFRNYSVGSEWLLGSSSLGAASVLGGMVTMGLPVVRVRIEKVTRDQVSLFYRDSQSYKNLEKILIPECVTEIGESAFKECSKLTIHTSVGSYAEKYAKENNIPLVAE